MTMHFFVAIAAIVAGVAECSMHAPWRPCRVQFRYRLPLSQHES